MYLIPLQKKRLSAIIKFHLAYYALAYSTNEELGQGDLQEVKQNLVTGN